MKDLALCSYLSIKCYKDSGDQVKSKFRTVRGYELQNADKLITPAMEDYLEMIYRHSLENDHIRITELSKLLNVKDSSVSKMIQKLDKLKLLNYEKYKFITLTEHGKKTGKFLLKRHNTIEKFLMLIGIKNNILMETELVEHVLSCETINKIENLNTFLESKDILEKYNNFKNNNK